MFGKEEVKVFLKEKGIPFHWVEHKAVYTIEEMEELGEKLGGVRLSFASEERLEKYLGLKKGAVTPLGILNDTACAVKVFLDKDFLGKEEIGVHPNDNTASVYLKTADLMQMIKEHGNSLEVLSFA